MRIKIQVFIYIILFLSVNKSNLFSQCAGLDADAGPDLFTCDPNMMVQLMGSIQGTYKKFMWTPSVGLSNAQVLDPMVTQKSPGIYKFKLTAEGLTSTNLVTNGDFENGNSGFSSEYNSGIPGSPFGPDWYGVGTNPQAYNSGFTNCGDNTSGGGNMLIVDGSTTPGKKVWCQTVPVTVGKTYQLEFYSMSVFPVAPGVVSIVVNGTNIGTTTVSGMCDWVKFEA